MSKVNNFEMYNKTVLKLVKTESQKNLYAQLSVPKISKNE